MTGGALDEIDCWRQEQDWRNSTLVSADDSNDEDIEEAFNGAELSESVLGRDWSAPEEEAVWSNL